MSEICAIDSRRKRLLRSALNGLDEVEVADDRRTLRVRFFHDAPPQIAASNLRVTGGVAVRYIRIIGVELVNSGDPDVPVLLEAALDRTGDISTYRLHVEGLPDIIDPRYASAPFLFFPDAGSGIDCDNRTSVEAANLQTPPLDYLAKDYAGFRQVMLDRLAVTLPTWQETHIPDIGIMLVELLAYAADRLSYYQDAVATEAYLDTARRRVSVRRHVRLIDYAMHEGCNARALVQIDPPIDTAITLAGISFHTADNNDTIQFLPVGAAVSQQSLRRGYSALRVHCWGDRGCILPAGAVSATLVNPDPGHPPGLQAGDFLIFEMVFMVPDAGGPDQPIPDPDPQHRHPVRLISVTQGFDRLLETPLLHIAWSAADALPADFPVTRTRSDALTLVRGNLVLADQGRHVTEGSWKAGTPVSLGSGLGLRPCITLSRHGLSFAEPIGDHDSAADILVSRNPRAALPQIKRLQSWPQRAAGEPPGPRADEAAAITWTIKQDLIDSGPDDADAVVEIDSDGTTYLRFGDGVCGRDPTGQQFEIAYLIGNGPAGNVGSDRLARAQSTREPQLGAWPVRNPLPAGGGTAHESVGEVRLLAPHQFVDVPMRAITADDYATLAVRLVPAVQRAACSLMPLGCRQLARIAIDPLGTDAPDPALQTRVATALEPYRRVGHDIEVTRADYVSLRLVLRVSLLPRYAQRDVRAALRAALGTGTLPDGSLAAFNPDNLTFGTPVYTSRIIAIAQALEGVRDVQVAELARQFDRERGIRKDGVLRMAWYEIPRLDNDPLRPDNGQLVLDLAGGLA